MKLVEIRTGESGFGDFSESRVELGIGYEFSESESSGEEENFTKSLFGHQGKSQVGYRNIFMDKKLFLQINIL